MPRQLTPEQGVLVERIVASGDYDNADQAIGKALRLLEERGRCLQLTEYTSGKMDRLLNEADERSRLGLPVIDAVKPSARICRRRRF